LTLTEIKAESSPARSLLIVARRQVDLFDALRRDLADYPDIQVLLDRRSGERRQHDLPVAGERRGRERRGLSSVGVTCVVGNTCSRGPSSAGRLVVYPDQTLLAFPGPLPRCQFHFRPREV
jgi:hypothetical protein